MEDWGATREPGSGVLDTVRATLLHFTKEHLYLTVVAIILIHLGIEQWLKPPKAPPALNAAPLTISEIFIYPIKSLRGTRVTAALATKNGFQNDRTFMLLQKTADGYKNMSVATYPEMTQFLTTIKMPKGNASSQGIISVEYIGTNDTKSKSLDIPLRPDTKELEPIEITMHNSATKAFKMQTKYNTWFTSAFGYEVALVYLGENLRDVLFEDLKPTSTSSPDHQITFQDCAPYLVISSTSLADVSSRLPADETMDMTKFRPNIVIDGAKDAWEEDFWGGLHISQCDFVLAHNCVRCASINVDYETGKPGTGESGAVLKKLLKDRRVDKGSKWSPVFGRYCYWVGRQVPRVFQVGDEVRVTKMNAERTEWSWKGL